MQKLKDIRDLQQLGFSLDEIKELYEEDSHTPSIRQMTAKIKETEAQLRQLKWSRDGSVLLPALSGVVRTFILTLQI